MCAEPRRHGAALWVKVKSRVTTEVIVGGVIGRLRAPEAVVAGRVTDGQLRIVGRTVALSSKQSELLAALLERPAGDHPWPDEISAGFGRRGTVPLTKVEPRLSVTAARSVTSSAPDDWREEARGAVGGVVSSRPVLAKRGPSGIHRNGVGRVRPPSMSSGPSRRAD
jgi:hypothetical protein